MFSNTEGNVYSQAMPIILILLSDLKKTFRLLPTYMAFIAAQEISGSTNIGYMELQSQLRGEILAARNILVIPHRIRI